MEPQCLLLSGLPHIAQLSFPWTRVFGGVGTQPPALADFIGHFLRNKPRRPAIHRAIAGGINDQVSIKLAAIGKRDGVRVNSFNAHAAAQLDVATGH